jgi:iron complex outermembrane receptor protein
MEISIKLNQLIHTFFILSSVSTLIYAENITLHPIDVQETNLTSGTVLLSEDEAKETGSITVQERLVRDISFSIVPDSKGEEAISFRGLYFKATEYVEDGIPLYRNPNGYIDAKLSTTNAAIQINDGSGTSTLGVSPMGGEVQINTTIPTNAFSSTLDTIISSNDEYYHAYVGSLVDNVYIQADASYYHRSDFSLSDDFDPTPIQPNDKRVNSDKEQKNIAIKSGIYLDEHTHLAAKVNLTRAEYGVPPNVYTDLDAPVWDAYARIDRKNLNSYYLYADYDTDDLALSFRAYYDDYEDIYKIYNEPEYQTNWPAVMYDDSRLGTIIKGIKIHGDHTSTFIFQADRNEHMRKGGELDTTKYQVDTFKLSYLHLWKVNPFWEVEGGLSTALMQTKKGSDASAIEPPEDKNTYDAQLKTTYTDDHSVTYGSIAKKSRMPAMSEMFTFFPWVNANPGLDPETSMQYTLGHQRDLADKTFLDLSLYYYDIKDLIIYRNDTYINRDEAENYGAEVRLGSTYFDKHHLRASYAYTHTQDSEGEAIEFIPLHQFKLEDTLTINANWKAYLGYQYIGSRYSQNSATYSSEEMKLSKYHLLDTQIFYKVSDSIHGRAGIKNILDEGYEWRYGYPAEGRSYYLSLEWKL